MNTFKKFLHHSEHFNNQNYSFNLNIFAVECAYKNLDALKSEVIGS